MPFRAIDFNTLKNTPKKVLVPSASRKKRVSSVMGDGHDNVLYATAMHILNGMICELPDDVYQRMQALYFKPPQLTIQAFRDCGHEFSDDQYAELEALLVRKPGLSPSQFNGYVTWARSQEDLAQEIENDDEKRRDQNNALMLRKLEFESLTAGQSKALKACYKQASCLTQAELREYCRLMREHVQFESVGEYLLLLGDMFADRGRNAWLMLNFFDHVVESGNYPILHFSNHDWAFFDFLFSKEIEQALKESVFQGDEADWPAYLQQLEDDAGAVKPGTWYKQLGESQARSLYELIACIKSDDYPDITLESCRALASKAVLPYLQVVTAVYEKNADAGCILTHAPVGPETLASLAKAMGVPYDVSSSEALFKTIQAANTAWREQCVTTRSFLPPKELEAQYPRGAQDFVAIGGQIPCPLTYPVLRCAYNRPNADDVSVMELPFEYAELQFERSPLVAVAKAFGAKEASAVASDLRKHWTWIHGHSGPVQSGPDFEVGLAAALDGLSGNARDAAGREFEKTYSREHPLASYLPNQVNMDSSTAGREGSFNSGRPIGPGDLDHFMVAASVEGVLSVDEATSPPCPHQEALQASRLHTLTWQFVRAFHGKLQQVAEPSDRLNKLNELFAAFHFIPNHALLAGQKPEGYRDSFSEQRSKLATMLNLIVECATELALTAAQRAEIKDQLSRLGVPATRFVEAEQGILERFFSDQPYQRAATMLQKSMANIAVKEGFIDILLESAVKSAPASLSEQKAWLLTRVDELFSPTGCPSLPKCLNCSSALMGSPGAGGAPPPDSAPAAAP